MSYVIGQIIGGVAFCLSLTAYHRKTKEKILGNMILSNIMNVLHYLLIDANTGFITKIVAILRDSFIILKNKNKKIPSNLFLGLFFVIYGIIAICTYTNLWSLFPVIAATIYLIPVWNGNEVTVKRIAFVCYILWLIYNIFVFSIPGIISNTISIISTFIAVYNAQKKIKE